MRLVRRLADLGRVTLIGAPVFVAAALVVDRGRAAGLILAAAGIAICALIDLAVWVYRSEAAED
jgi:hypothetical protein